MQRRCAVPSVDAPGTPEAHPLRRNGLRPTPMDRSSPRSSPPPPWPPGQEADRPPVVLVVSSPAPAGTVPLAAALWPSPDERWSHRYGLERLRLLGDWLRHLHRSRTAAPDRTDAPMTGVHVVRERLATAVHAPPGPATRPLGRAHWASLLQWADLLGRADAGAGSSPAHGRLRLEEVGWAEEPAGDLLVPEPVGSGRAHPAIDVGWVTGDLLRWVHHARARGSDPSVFERLLSAFLTGYHGLAGRRGASGDLDVHRAAALRVAWCSIDATDPREASLDLHLTRFLVEHCWSAAARDGG